MIFTNETNTQKDVELEMPTILNPSDNVINLKPIAVFQ